MNTLNQLFTAIGLMMLVAYIACIQYESFNVAISRSFQIVNLAQARHSRKDDEAFLLA